VTPNFRRDLTKKHPARDHAVAGPSIVATLADLTLKHCGNLRRPGAFVLEAIPG